MAKTKLSVTVDKTVARALDRASKKTSRSEIVELALVRWLRDQRKQTLEAEVERYYKEMSEEERQEDREWAETGYQATGKTWR